MENLEKAATHDLGGRDEYMSHPVHKGPHPEMEDDFSRRVDALRLVVTGARLMTVDEMRRGVEELSPEDYHGLTYYERWLKAIVATLIRRGCLDARDLA